MGGLSTLVYRIDVHARLLILRKKIPLHGLILVCTFIDFEKKFPPARLFHPAHFTKSNLKYVLDKYLIFAKVIKYQKVSPEGVG